jgi:hypothetical protein
MRRLFPEAWRPGAGAHNQIAGSFAEQYARALEPPPIVTGMTAEQVSALVRVVAKEIAGDLPNIIREIVHESLAKRSA